MNTDLSLPGNSFLGKILSCHQQKVKCRRRRRVPVASFQAGTKGTPTLTTSTIKMNSSLPNQSEKASLVWEEPACERFYEITAVFSDGAKIKDWGLLTPLEERNHTPILGQHLFVNASILEEAQCMMNF